MNVFITPKFQAYLEILLDRFEANPAREGLVLCLYVEGRDYLVVENNGNCTLTVANYLEMGGVLRPDPLLVFYTGYNRYCRRFWAPIEVSQLFGGWRQFAELNPYAEGLQLHDRVGQMKLAYLCESQYLPNLIEDGWLELGEKAAWPRVPKSIDECVLELLAYLHVHQVQGGGDAQSTD
jgi:hypothetical protein